MPKTTGKKSTGKKSTGKKAAPKKSTGKTSAPRTAAAPPAQPAPQAGAEGMTTELQQALLEADRLWPRARKAPLGGGESFPAATFVAKLTGADLRVADGTAIVRWRHTVLAGPLAGKTWTHSRWLNEDWQEQYLAGEIEGHGYPSPASLAAELSPLLSRMITDGPIVLIRTWHSGDQGQYTNGQIIRTVNADEVDAVAATTGMEEMSAGAPATAAALPSDGRPAEAGECWSAFEAGNEGCEACTVKDQCAAASPGIQPTTDTSTPAAEAGPSSGIEKPEGVGECWATFEADNEGCAACEFKEHCELATAGGGGAPQQEPTATQPAQAGPPEGANECWGSFEAGNEGCEECGFKDDCAAVTAGATTVGEGPAAPAVPDVEELQALCKEWGIKLTPAQKKSPEAIMKHLHDEHVFPRSQVSPNEADLFERFPAEFQVTINEKG